MLPLTLWLKVITRNLKDILVLQMKRNMNVWKGERKQGIKVLFVTKQD